MPKESIIVSFVRRIAGLTTVNDDFGGKPVLKGDKDSMQGGLDYGLEALGARRARGDVIEPWEIDTLVEKARDLGVKDPETYVSKLINSWERAARSTDDRW